MRVLALLATYNEERFIVACLEHLIRHGIEVCLLDNESTDRTVELASRFLGHGLIGIESLPRNGAYRWRSILARKEELASELDAEWFLHVDADEFRLPRSSRETLAEALARVDNDGFNAVNFIEFSFVPTRQSPDHDHPAFLDTMRWYYPFHPPSFPHQLKAWKRQPQRIDLASTAGHRVAFPGLRMYPDSFPMRHYLFLSPAHAMRKYVRRVYDAGELARGWHRQRSRLRAEHVVLQDEAELRRYVSDDALDPSEPLERHPLFSV